ncbi:DUF3331 domain-containing protein [Caballeronia novacaledonica]|uniref:DUF3331 domain-containing protein n=1 Tax=Caballeronia novacaledonica TaxID=1544861 RepID=UPI00283A8F4E|nr:DUF3331 domain-containing protein [Caballeronia novacaledonica]
MNSEAAQPSVVAPSEATRTDDGVRDAMSRIMETFLGLRIQRCQEHTLPISHLGNTRSCRVTDTTATNHSCRKLLPARIEIVERPSSETLTIYWSDARTGRYADQLWRLSRARVKTFCVLSGAPIHVGDEVFRPQSRGVDGPTNRDFMILADAIPRAGAEPEDS